MYKIQHTEKPKLDYSAPVVENAQLESDSLHPVTTKRKLDDIHSENESSDLPLKKASTTVEVSSNLISEFNDEVQSSSSAFVDLDSKKRQREHSQSNVIVEENDDIARTRKISRTSQQNPNDGNLSGSIISPARPNIHKPLISLHHIPSEISCQQVDNKESDPQKTYIRPALKSRHAVFSIVYFSKLF